MSLLDVVTSVATGGGSSVIGAVADVAGKLIERWMPDPQAAAKAKQDLAQMLQNGELAHLASDTDLLKGQMATNTVEAGSTMLFVAGWRPFIGWVCGAGLAYSVILEPFATWAARIAGVTMTLPIADTSLLNIVLMGMLGLAGMRTYEKVNGVSAGH